MKIPTTILALAVFAIAAPLHAVFDNTCLIFNIASRGNAMDDTWLSDSLFYLSAKKKKISVIRNLTYVEEEDEDTGNQATSTPDENILGDEEVRFIPSETKTVDAEKTASE